MCPHEVEVKSVLLNDPEPEKGRQAIDAVLKSLLLLGAREKGIKEQTDLYLEHPCRDLSGTDESVRIRSERALPPSGDGSWRTVMTYKGPKVSSLTKTRYEREVPFRDRVTSEDVMDLFARLGFKEVMVVNKVRTALDLDGIEASLDLVAGLGAFLELEVVSDDIVQSERRLLSVLERLGLKGTERKAYLQLLLEKGLNR